MYKDKGTSPDGQQLKRIVVRFERREPLSTSWLGGYAVGVHAQPRVTKDLDVFIEASKPKAEAVYAALVDFGARLEGIEVADFQNPASILRIGVPPICVEIMQHIDGVSFEVAYGGSEEYIVDGDVPARYISAEHLIINKRAVGRLQDLADAEAIARAQSLHRNPEENLR